MALSRSRDVCRRKGSRPTITPRASAGSIGGIGACAMHGSPRSDRPDQGMSMNVTGNVAKDLALSGIRGQYGIGAGSGLIGAGINGDIFQFRWSDLTRICAVRKVTLTVVPSTPFGAAPASAPAFYLTKATGWTGQGTGGTSLDTTTGSCRRRTLPPTPMPASLLAAGDVRIATTVALGNGTKTFDAQAQAVVIGTPVSSATGPIVTPTDLINVEASELDYPLELGTNEGFTIAIVGNPGTGTMIASVSVDWMELNG